MTATIADAIIRSMMSKTMEVMVLPCFVLMRPHVEYFVNSGRDIFKETRLMSHGEWVKNLGTCSQISEQTPTTTGTLPSNI